MTKSIAPLREMIVHDRLDHASIEHHTRGVDNVLATINPVLAAAPPTRC